MSLRVEIHLWLGLLDPKQYVESFGKVLDSVSPARYLDKTERSADDARFRRLTVFKRDQGTVVRDEPIDTDRVPLIIERLSDYVGDDFSFRVDSGFNYFRYDRRNRQIEEAVGGIEISYYAPNYEWGGVYFKTYGPIVVYFSSKSSFYGPRDFKELTGSNRLSYDVVQQAINRLTRNYDAVDTLAKRIVNVLDPIHLIVCTDLEVSPLTAHGIYHRDWGEYLADLKKIVRLHDRGGVYFTELSPGDPAYVEPRKQGAGYGYLRHYEQSKDQLDSFGKGLGVLLRSVSERPERIDIVSKKELDRCFSSLKSTKVESIKNSYYLSAYDAPFAYLEEPYFELCQALYGRSF